LNLPASPSDLQEVTYLSHRWGAIPTEVAPMSSSLEETLLKALIKGINQRYKTTITPSSFSRDKSLPAVTPAATDLRLLLLGGDGASHLRDVFYGLGVNIRSVIQADWELKKECVDVLVDKLRDELHTVPAQTPVVLYGLESACYRAYTPNEDLRRIACEKDDPRGIHHVEGALTVIPNIIANGVASNINRIQKAVSPRKLVVLTPVPCYAVSRCCWNVTHATNYDDPGFQIDICQATEDLLKHFRRACPEKFFLSTGDLLVGKTGATARAIVGAMATHFTEDLFNCDIYGSTKLAMGLLNGGLPPGSSDTRDKRRRTDSDMRYRTVR